jgi:RHS repeat-associated protein
VDVAIDYSQFRYAFGSGYADRLRVVSLPDCALATPVPAGCRVTGEPVAARNDVKAAKLVASVSGPALLAVVSDASGETGNFTATPLGVSDRWQVAAGSGDFSWSYPIAVPQPPIGTAPAVALGYSSAAVDGLVSSHNTQGPQAGVGWSDFASSFVERRYTSCADTVGTRDLCWRSFNATLALNGRASELVSLDGNYRQWRLTADPGWLVERLTGGANDDQGSLNGNQDDRGEYWKVTTPDGTQYFFGRGSNPDTGAATGSVWTVPVVADHAGEPCREGAGACRQAWRWNLDRVVDTNGIVTTYYYGRELNKYAAIGGLGGDDQYTRSGWLDRIEYGKPKGTGTEVQPAGRVKFHSQYRCNALNTSCTTAPTFENGSQFLDVPNDLICPSTGRCRVTAPTFFTARRYSAVLTEVFVGGAWKPVEQVELLHGPQTNSDGLTLMHLNGVQRLGLSKDGVFQRLPAVNFLYTQLPNRVDVDAASGRTAMGHFRLGVIVDEYGGFTQVTYGQPNRCAASYTGPWDTNGKDCFPQKVGSRFGVFHKYLVSRVERRDQLGGSPAMTTTYAYEGTPAWHHADDEFIRSADQSWSDWRGYGTTTVTTGAQRTKVQVFRGMHGDRRSGGGTRLAQVEPFNGAGFDTVPAVNDEPWLAGSVLLDAKLGPLGEVVEAGHHTYDVRITAQPGTDPQDWARWIGQSTATSSAAKSVGAFEQQRTTTTYNAFFQPETVYEEGWLNQTGDERCTRTTYAVNQSPSVWLVDRPASETRLAGPCSTTTVLSATETYYDGSTALGAAPTKGNATRQRVRLDASRWAVTAETAYDVYGRVARVTDAKGLVTATTHEATPNGGYPRQTAVTQTVGGIAHTSVTEWLPQRGLPLRQTDPNGGVTTYGYDGLGRLLTVRQPTEQNAPADKYSWQFTYTESQTKAAPPIVRTRRLQSNDLTRYEDSWIVYDSFLRKRQEHRPSPVANTTVVTATRYNATGQVEDETEPQPVAGTPGSRLLPETADNTTKTLYDALGRPTRQGWYRGGTEQWATITTYTHDTTTVAQPGGRQSRTTVDGLGRDIRMEEHDGTAWQTTSHGYDLADRLTSITDPAANRSTFSYNLAGWRTGQDTPDGGAATMTYDDAGNLVTITDAKGTVLHTSYDVLSRPTARRSGSATGPVLARWEYDAAGEKGLLNRSIRVTAGGEWVLDVVGYDARNRPTATRWTVPLGVAGLAGSYQVGYTYDRADHITSVSYPTVGGLPAETVTTRYNAFGQAEHLAGIDEYVWSAMLDSRARLSTVGLGPRPGGQTWLARNYSYDADQRLSRMQTAASGALTVDHVLGYDQPGMLVSRTTQHGTQSWRECFGHDRRDRLTAAYTTTAAACDGTGKGTGPQPYNHTYAYTVDGNLTTRVEGGTSVTYSYPTGAGVDRPHAPTGVGADRYTWDPNGNLANRTVAGTAETFTWDAERQLASIAAPSGVTSFLYDPDGARLLRTTPTERTLFLPGHEITANASGTSVTAVRSYAFADETVATRTPTGVTYLVEDQQGSVEAAFPAGGALQSTRTYQPYGKRRSGGELPTDKGWIGQIEDDTTKLSYLDERYHDPNIGRFISPDPIYDAAAPQSLNSFSYGLNSPATHSDPSGAWVPIGAKGTTAKIGWHHKWPTRTNLKNVARAQKIHTRSRQPLSHFVERVTRKHNAYMNSELHRRRVAAMTLRKMHHANSNPAFWRALAGAGSAQGLVLGGLRAANPDPAFWHFLHRVGQRRAIAIAKDVEMTHRVNENAQTYFEYVSEQFDQNPDEWRDRMQEAFRDEIERADPQFSSCGPLPRHSHGGCWFGSLGHIGESYGRACIFGIPSGGMAAEGAASVAYARGATAAAQAISRAAPTIGCWVGIATRGAHDAGLWG